MTYKKSKILEIVNYINGIDENGNETDKHTIREARDKFEVSLPTITKFIKLYNSNGHSKENKDVINKDMSNEIVENISPIDMVILNKLLSIFIREGVQALPDDFTKDEGKRIGVLIQKMQEEEELIN